MEGTSGTYNNWLKITLAILFLIFFACDFGEVWKIWELKQTLSTFNLLLLVAFFAKEFLLGGKFFCIQRCLLSSFPSFILSLMPISIPPSTALKLTSSAPIVDVESMPDPA